MYILKMNYVYTILNTYTQKYECFILHFEQLHTHKNVSIPVSVYACSKWDADNTRLAIHSRVVDHTALAIQGHGIGVDTIHPTHMQLEHPVVRDRVRRPGGMLGGDVPDSHQRVWHLNPLLRHEHAQ